jgi:hypothetical protein
MKRPPAIYVSQPWRLVQLFCGINNAAPLSLGVLKDRLAYRICCNVIPPISHSYHPKMDYFHTNVKIKKKLTGGSRAHLEKSLFAHLLNKFPTKKFITVFARGGT